MRVIWMCVPVLVFLQFLKKYRQFWYRFKWDNLKIYLQLLYKVSSKVLLYMVSSITYTEKIEFTKDWVKDVHFIQA